MPTADTTVDPKEFLASEEQPIEKLAETRRTVHCSIERRNAMEHALEDFGSIAKKLSSENKAEVRRAAALWMLGRVEEALPVLEAARSSRERDFLLGTSYLDLGRAAAAVPLLKGIVEGDDPSLQALVAEAELKAGDPEAAGARLDRVLKKHPESADAQYVRGLVHDLAGERDKAVDCYEEALSHEPGHARAMFRLAYMNDLAGDDDAALELYEQLRKLRPIHVNTMINLGLQYEDRGFFNRALDCYQAVLDYFPTHVRAKAYAKDASASLNMYYDEEAAKREQKIQAMLSQPLTDVSFSQRVRTALARLGVLTVGDLVMKSEDDLLEIPNFGKTSLTELREFLAQRGLSLASSKTGAAGAAPGVPTLAAPGICPPETAVKPLADFEWSGRIRKSFERLGLETIGDLMKRSESELQGKNLGATSIKEIRRKLGSLGVQMRIE